jgi:hypothetical protein
MPAATAGVRYPFSRVLLHRTRLAYVHLRNLLNDAKRDRTARVSGYVGIWLPEELVLLYLQKGEVVNATHLASQQCEAISISAALARVPAEPEYGEICFHTADDEQLAAMYVTQTQAPEPWPAELQVRDPKALFPYLMAMTFDGIVEIIVEGGYNYLIFKHGAVRQAFLATVQRGTLVERVSRLFGPETRHAITVRRWPGTFPLPMQAPPALIQAYRELATGVVQRLASTGRESAPTVAELARTTLLESHPALEALGFNGRPTRDPVTDTEGMTTAMAAWLKEVLWAMADHDELSHEQLLKELVWERRHLFQSAGLFDRIPWKIG